jgi:hypothetical protein
VTPSRARIQTSRGAGFCRSPFLTDRVASSCNESAGDEYFCQSPGTKLLGNPAVVFIDIITIIFVI